LLVSKGSSIKSMPKDIRVGDIIYSDDKAQTEVVLIGFPSDEGVRRNGGRPGASKAPELIRSLFKKLTPHPELFDEHVAVLKSIHDVGDIEVTGNLEEDQLKLGNLVESVLAANQIPIILGGGHETSFGHVLGYYQHRNKISVINWDAHPDVRPLKEGLAHSGSPFRQALDLGRGTVIDYTVAGLQPQHVAREHLEYLNLRKSAWFMAEDIDKVAIQGIFHGVTRSTMVSIDMDVVSQTFAPGVSAPTAGGITDRQLFEIAYQAGLHKLVRSFDLVEVNPDFDKDYQTVRLAAVALWWFTVGLAKRPKKATNRDD
jgi:formiminoglutamase